MESCLILQCQVLQLGATWTEIRASVDPSMNFDAVLIQSLSLVKLSDGCAMHSNCINVEY